MADPGPALATASRVTYCLGSYEITVPTRYGPRLLGLRAAGSPELLARLDADLGIDTVGLGTFHFGGGHRLWSSPERPELTYAPDDRPCAVSYDSGVLRVVGPTDAAGFGKELRVQVQDDELVVDHLLSWEGTEPVTAGAWAITQLPLGGTALLPLAAPDGGSSYQADRSLVVWPYTDLSDPRLSFAAACAVIQARRGGRFKLGSSPAPGRLGYLRDGWLFTKSVEPVEQAHVYPDREAVGQMFVNEDFCELESAGPLATLQPGDSLQHRERWRVEECAGVEAALETVVPA